MNTEYYEILEAANDAVSNTSTERNAHQIIYFLLLFKDLLSIEIID